MELNSLCDVGIDLPPHVPHRNRELLPAPAIFAPIYFRHNALEFLESGFRLVPHVVLGYFVPVLLWHLPLGAASFDLMQKVVNGHVLLRLAVKPWRVPPRLVDGLQIELLDLECFQHGTRG